MWNRFGLLTCAILAGTLVVDLLLPLGFAAWAGYLFAVTAARYWGGGRAIALTVGGAYVLLVLDLWLGPPGVLSAGLFNKAFGLAVIGLTGAINWRQHRAEERLRHALEEVTALRGLLPICSFCKKIRRDDGGWEPMEKYISDRSEAEFSHGLCDACAQEHYPEVLGSG